MKEKFVNPNYKKMYEVLREKIAPQLSMSMCVLLVFSLLSYFLFALGFFPISYQMVKLLDPANGMPDQETLSNLLLTVKITPVTKICTFVLMYGAVLLCQMMIFGIMTFFTFLMVDGKVKFSDLFIGFNSKNKNIWANSAVISLITVIPFGISFLIRDIVQKGQIVEVATKSEMAVKLLVYIGIPALIVLILRILTCFSDVNIVSGIKRFPNCFNKSFEIFKKGNFFHFVGFEIFVNYKNILILILCYAIDYFIPENMQVLSLFIEFIIFVQEYTVAAKILGGVPVYYYSFLSCNKMINRDNFSISREDVCSKASGRNVDIVVNDDKDEHQVDIVVEDKADDKNDVEFKALDEEGNNPFDNEELKDKTDDSNNNSTEDSSSSEK